MMTIKKGLQTYLQEHSPNKYNKAVNSYQDVLKTWTPSLVQISKVNGRAWAVNYIAAWIVHLNEVTNAKAKMSPESINFVAESIFDDYSFRLADLTLFFKRIRKGVYGDFYENISEMKLLKWWDTYYSERADAAQKISEKNNTEFRVNEDKMHPEVIEEMFKGIGDELLDHRNEEKKDVGKEFLKNKKMMHAEFVATLEKKVKTASKEDLQKTIKNWKSRNDMISYVNILQTELDAR